jgi:hypothetical protein
MPTMDGDWIVVDHLALRFLRHGLGSTDITRLKVKHRSTGELTYKFFLSKPKGDLPLRFSAADMFTPEQGTTLTMQSYEEHGYWVEGLNDGDVFYVVVSKDGRQDRARMRYETTAVVLLHE